MARVFVGIPTRNRPQWVPLAIRSVVEQTMQDFRIVVSDNASEPASASRVAAFVESLDDRRISYHLQETDVEEYGQGRFLFGRCEAPFFAILHDDDLLRPSYLETAVERLERDRQLACFVANPKIIGADGCESADGTRRYLEEHGRARQREGSVDILESVLRSGFVPISGTVFRTSALRESGFVDPQATGSYPFEVDLLLRLGERGGRAWFTPEQLVAFRFHDAALRSPGVFFNPEVVRSLIGMLERRRFSGAVEGLRRWHLVNFVRRYGLIRMLDGDRRGGRQHLLRAVRMNPASVKSWAFAAAGVLCPPLLRSWGRGKHERERPVG